MISRFLLDDFSNKVVVVDEATTYAEGDYMARDIIPQ